MDNLLPRLKAEGVTGLAQIKEKFGELRVYIDSGTVAAHVLIAQAEKDSRTTCEICGEPGRLRSDGWMKTRCDECEAA